MDDAAADWPSTVDAKMARAAKETLEFLLEQEAAQLAKLEGHRRHGYAPRRVWYRGFKIDGLRVPRIRTPDGIRMPPLYAELLELRREETVRLARDGYSARTVEQRERGLGRGSGGRSRSNVQRARADAQGDSLATMMERRFDDAPLVAVMLDGTAVGKMTAMVATGVLADGTRKGLGVVVGPTENGDLVGSLLRSLTRRGVDRGVLWIADQGTAIRSEINALFPAGGTEQPRIQVCTVHKSRNVAKHLRPLGEAVQEDVRKRIYQAWAERDPDEALRMLEGLAVELDERGRRIVAGKGKKARKLGTAYVAAADSLRTNVADTVTVKRLGVTGQLSHQLRTTNVQESANSWLKRVMGAVTNWNQAPRGATRDELDRMRLNWVAEAFMEQEETAWTRFGDVVGLVDLLERLELRAGDVERLRDAAPPHLSVWQISVPADDAGGAELAAKTIGGADAGVAIGSAAALAELGLEQGQSVGRAELALALRGRHVKSGEPVLAPSKGRDRQVNEHGTVEDAQPTDVAGARWSYVAPPRVGRLWSRADAAGRADLEAAVMRSAEAALERVTRKTAAADGVAAVAKLSVIELAGSPGTVEIRVDGALLAVKERNRRLASPAVKETFSSREARHAEDVAARVIDGAIGPLPTAEREPRAAAADAGLPAERPAAVRDDRSHDPLTKQRRELLGSRRAAEIEARADVLQAALASRDDDWLREQRAGLGDPFRSLEADARGAKMTLRLERDRLIAEQDLNKATAWARERSAAQARGRLEGHSQTAAALRAKGRHLDRWMHGHAVGPDGRKLLRRDADGQLQPLTNAEVAARVVALEREAFARGIELGPAVDRAAAQTGQAALAPGAGRGF